MIDSDSLREVLRDRSFFILVDSLGEKFRVEVGFFVDNITSRDGQSQVAKEHEDLTVAINLAIAELMSN
jgi:hypothetical protein